MAPANSNTASSGQGLPALDQAIAILGQLNAFLPMGIGLGVQLVQLIRNARGSADVPPEEVERVIEEFRRLSSEVRQTADEWLAQHPRTEG